jgi:sulfane dehydrogenase subunit SoxC
MPNVAGAHSKPIPPGTHVKPVPAEFFIHHDVCVETRWEQMYGRGFLTPASLFYVRNHGPTPIIDATTWKLSIAGSGVARPITIDYDRLLKMPSMTLTCFIECAGNGRVFFDEYQGRVAKGRPWRFGSYGVAEWTGVPLRHILEMAGLRDTAVDVMPTGLDNAKVERPMSIAKALDGDTIVAYAMNGDILPADHGFPARVVVPGWVGVNSIKWVGSITVSDAPIYVMRNTEEYVLEGPGFDAEPPALGPLLTTVPVRSAIALGWPGKLKAGPQSIRGFAWSGHGTVAQVEYSFDDGASWNPANIVGPNERWAGCRWEFQWDAPTGEHTITIRATDSAGNCQPAPSAMRWNERGYEFWAAVAHPVSVI